MTRTLKERLSVAMRDASVTAADLARACKIKPPSVSNWISGETKSIRGSNLLAAARLLGVTPEWLSTGQGQRGAAEPALPLVSQTMRLDPETVRDALHTLQARHRKRYTIEDMERDPAEFVTTYETIVAVLSGRERPSAPLAQVMPFVPSRPNDRDAISAERDSKVPDSGRTERKARPHERKT